MCSKLGKFIRIQKRRFARALLALPIVFAASFGNYNYVQPAKAVGFFTSLGSCLFVLPGIGFDGCILPTFTSLFAGEDRTFNFSVRAGSVCRVIITGINTLVEASINGAASTVVTPSTDLNIADNGTGSGDVELTVASTTANNTVATETRCSMPQTGTSPSGTPPSSQEEDVQTTVQNTVTENTVKDPYNLPDGLSIDPALRDKLGALNAVLELIQLKKANLKKIENKRDKAKKKADKLAGRSETLKQDAARRQIIQLNDDINRIESEITSITGNPDPYEGFTGALNTKVAGLRRALGEASQGVADRRLFYANGGVPPDERKANEEVNDLNSKIEKCEKEIKNREIEAAKIDAEILALQRTVSGSGNATGTQFDNFLPSRTPSTSEQAISSLLKLDDDEDNSNPLAERINRAFNHQERNANGLRGLTTWVNGSFSGASGGNLATARDSNSFNLSTGAQYQVNETVALGAALRIANTDSETIGTGTEIDSILFGLALFSNILLPEDIRLQVTGAYEMASNDVLSNGSTGSFTYDSLIFSVSVSKAFELQNGWTFTPNARYATSRTDQESYVDSTGTLINGQDFDVSVLSYGGTLSGKVYDSGTSDQDDTLGIVQIGANLGLAGTTFLERADGGQDPSDTSNLQNESGGATLSGGLNLLFDNAATASIGSSITFADGEDPWTIIGSYSKPIDGTFTDAKLKPSSFAFTGSYTDLPDDRFYWTLGGSVEMQLQSFIENAPAGSTLSFAADVSEGNNQGANARLNIPIH
ncbi:MAG: autotransporter outer membrane beta-barrel domain-containing protein [Pseudomonadota bacterium]